MKELFYLFFSNGILTGNEKDVLKLGLEFDLPSKKIKFAQHYLAYEKLDNNFLYIQIAREADHTFEEASSVIKEI